MSITKKDLQDALRAQSKELKSYVDRRLDQRLAAQTKELKTYADEQTEALARIVQKALEEQTRHFDERLEALAQALDVRKQVERHEKRLLEIERALNA